MALKKKKGLGTQSKARKRVARKTAKTGGVGNSSHRTGISTKAENYLKQRALEGKVDISSKEKYQKELAKLQKASGTAPTSHNQRKKATTGVTKNATTKARANKVKKAPKRKK